MSAMHAKPITIAIASGKGGVGKSFLALNLAWCLSELGQTVTLIELDTDAGALSIAAGLGEPKARGAAADPLSLASRAVAIPGAPRAQLLRAVDIPAQHARSPATLHPWLAHLASRWRIIDLGPGMGAQNVLWLRRATPGILIGTPELVTVQAMLRLHMQLRRQHVFEWLCTREPRVRTGGASLSATRQRLVELVGAPQAERLESEASLAFRGPQWTFNRVLPDDAGQLARITSYLRRQAGTNAAQPWCIPEDAAQARCARYGRVLAGAEATSSAAHCLRKLAAELIASQATPRISVEAQHRVA